MLVKVHDTVESSGSRHRAGCQAEEQMAFYLNRAFDTRPDIAILHDLRLRNGDDIAQLDHLIVHPHGVIIIESKSVTTTVRCNERCEWSRLVGNRYRGMPSPVLQAQRQGAVLRQVITTRKPELGTEWHGAIMVAISDTGIVSYRGHSVELARTKRAVGKADQVPERIATIIRRRESHPGASWRTESVAYWLLSQHESRHPTHAVPENPWTIAEVIAQELGELIHEVFQL